MFNIDVEDGAKRVLEGSNYIIISHATSYWDKDSSSRLGVQNLIQFGKDKRVPIIALVHEEAAKNKKSAKKYFIKDRQADLVVASTAGQHRLEFPRAHKIFISGGNLTLCLCEAIRDTARKASEKDIEIFLVRDAIYDYKRMYDPIEKESVESFIEGFFIPNFECPWQNFFRYPLPVMEDTKLIAHFDNELIGEYDLMPFNDLMLRDLSKEIKIHFINSTDLDLYL